MSDRQTPESRLHALTDPHASIVEADGTVRPSDTRPIPGWQNHAGGATRGVKEYRGDQHAGVDNSVQAAQGCRVAAGVSDGADLCTLGTADSPVHMREQDKARTARRSLYCAIQGRRRHEACYYGGWGLLGHLIGAVLPIALMPPHWPAYGFLMPMATFFGMFAIGHVVAGIGVLLGGGRYG